ncbi:hypothetical protein JYU04_02210 [Dehalococcoides mccartyi]|nr:hypothetical protein [Dehalococcoides mccartyi]
MPSGIVITLGAIILVLSACSSAGGDGSSNLEVPGTFDAMLVIPGDGDGSSLIRLAWDVIEPELLSELGVQSRQATRLVLATGSDGPLTIIIGEFARDDIDRAVRRDLDFEEQSSSLGTIWSGEFRGVERSVGLDNDATMLIVGSERDITDVLSTSPSQSLASRSGVQQLIALVGDGHIQAFSEICGFDACSASGFSVRGSQSEMTVKIGYLFDSAEDAGNAAKKIESLTSLVLQKIPTDIEVSGTALVASFELDDGDRLLTLAGVSGVSWWQTEGNIAAGQTVFGFADRNQIVYSVESSEDSTLVIHTESLGASGYDPGVTLQINGELLTPVKSENRRNEFSFDTRENSRSELVLNFPAGPTEFFLTVGIEQGQATEEVVAQRRSASARLTATAFAVLDEALAANQDLATPTQVPVPISLPTPTIEPTRTPTPTSIPAATTTPIPTPRPTSTPTVPPMPTSTPVPTVTPSPTPTATPSPTPTSTPPPTSTPTPLLVDVPPEVINSLTLLGPVTVAWPAGVSKEELLSPVSGGFVLEAEVISPHDRGRGVWSWGVSVSGKPSHLIWFTSENDVFYWSGGGLRTIQLGEVAVTDVQGATNQVFISVRSGVATLTINGKKAATIALSGDVSGTLSIVTDLPDAEMLSGFTMVTQQLTVRTNELVKDQYFRIPFISEQENSLTLETVDVERITATFVNPFRASHDLMDYGFRVQLPATNRFIEIQKDHFSGGEHKLIVSVRFSGGFEYARREIFLEKHLGNKFHIALERSGDILLFEIEGTQYQLDGFTLTDIDRLGEIEVFINSMLRTANTSDPAFAFDPNLFVESFQVWGR